MSVTSKGDFVTINNKTTVRISDIKSIQPQSMVSFDSYGNVLGRDFPKIIIVTNDNRFEALYGTDEERDKDLTELQEIVASSSIKSEQRPKSDSININVADSSNVNIVSGSSNVSISQKVKEDINNKIDQLLSELSKESNVNEEMKEELAECASDIRDKVNSDKKVPKFTIKSLLNLTSQISSLSSLGLSIAQLIGG